MGVPAEEAGSPKRGLGDLTNSGMADGGMAVVDEAGAVDGIGTEQLSNLGNTRGVLLRDNERLRGSPQDIPICSL